ncbi:MAG: chaperone modulatory protein CbpM [Actinomycetota bacterium]|jgi:pimeloyl-ACP methyl ester carboxylesterase|nr:chaperone modulatory protein CbpM [Actinomycetota bacterium]
MTDVLVRRKSLDLQTFSRAAGMHPDLVRRLVTLGLLDATPGPGVDLSFARDQLAAVARIRRLRESLALNYAAIGLVAELLDRVAELERLRRRTPATEGRQWI